MSKNITRVYVDPRNFTLKSGPRNSTYTRVYTVSHFDQKYRLTNSVMASFNATMVQMTEISQKKNDRNVSMKKNSNQLYLYSSGSFHCLL